MFWQIFQIPCVFPESEFLLPFSLFSLWRGYPVIRDWSLITGRGGGLQNGRGGAREVLPLRKGEAEKVLAMLKGGAQKVWG